MFLVRAVVAVLLGALVVPQTAQAAPTSFADEVRGKMHARHGAQPLVEPSRFAGDRWVFGTTTVPLTTAEHESPQSSLFVAHKESRKWRVELEGSAGFVELARQAPREVVSDSEKDLFAQNFQAQPLAATGLGLPWPQGVSWWMGGGPHGNSGSARPFSSIDFNGGDGRVLSAGAGKVYKSCVRGRSALVKVVHPNGFSTTYYHMYDLTTLADGSNVQTGTYLGHIGNELPCGGSSTGAHVHFSLLRGNTHVSVNGQSIGGWTFYEGSQAYGGYALRNGVRVNTGGRVTNYGA
jgi:LasA protease